MRVAETHSLLSGDLLASVVIQKVCVLMLELRSSVILIQGSSLSNIILVPSFTARVCKWRPVDILHKSVLSFHSASSRDWTRSQMPLPTKPSSWLPFLWL